MFRWNCIFCKNFTLLRLRNNCKFGFNIWMIFEDDSSSFRIVETGFSKLYFFCRADINLRNLTISFDGDRKHIISNSLDINCHDSFIFFNGFRSELYFNQFLWFLRNDSTLRIYLELILKEFVFTQNFEVICKLDWRGIF